MSVINDKFDKTVVLTLSSRPDRRHHMETMLSSAGIGVDEWHVTVPFPYNALLANAFNQSLKRRCFTKPNEVDCAKSHYTIIKKALDEGVERLLVMEDDILLIKDPKVLEEFVNDMPEDFDILQFGGFTVQNVDDILDQYSNGVRWVKHPTKNVWNASMYALSRKGMKYYIAFMDKWFTVADMPLYKAPLNEKIVNAYISTMPIAIQADKKKVASDIRDEKTDSIDYSTMNAYESRVAVSDYYEVQQ